jgi:hypothetical protein
MAAPLASSAARPEHPLCPPVASGDLVRRAGSGVEVLQETRGRGGQARKAADPSRRGRTSLAATKARGGPGLLRSGPDAHNTE